MPRYKADQGWVDFFYETPDPIEPEGLESVDGWTANQGPDTAERVSKRLNDPTRHLLVDRAVVLERHPRVVPLAIRLGPDRPIPVTNGLLAPTLNAVPHDLSAAVGKPPPVVRTIEWRLRPRERHHRGSTRVEDGLHVAGERRPVLDRIRGAAITGMDSDHFSTHQPVLRPNRFARRAPRESLPVDDLAGSITKPRFDGVGAGR